MFYETGLHYVLLAVLNSLCRTGWLQINRDLNVPAVQALVLKAFATMSAKDIFKETNASIRLGKTFMNHIYNNEIVFRIYEKLSKLNNKKQNDPSKWVLPKKKKT